jgi:uncharacterized FlaG/YvyC family protein
LILQRRTRVIQKLEEASGEVVRQFPEEALFRIRAYVEATLDEDAIWKATVERRT